MILFSPPQPQKKAVTRSEKRKKRLKISIKYKYLHRQCTPCDDLTTCSASVTVEPCLGAGGVVVVGGDME